MASAFGGQKVSDKITFSFGGGDETSLSIVRARTDWPVDCRYLSPEDRKIVTPKPSVSGEGLDEVGRVCGEGLEDV